MKRFMWQSGVVAIRLFLRRLEGLKPLALWERGWGEGFTLSNFRSQVANLFNKHHRAERPHPRPLSQRERGEAVTRSGIAAFKTLPTQNAFAAGSASSKAMVEFWRASYGVMG